MPLSSSVLRLADVAAQAAGVLRRPFSADSLMEKAQKRSGLSDFGDLSFVDPLRRLLAACVAESDLSLVGRFATQWDVLRFLTNLLQFRAAEQADPDILAEPIERPIFIAGLPRSGTTFLHRLLLEDPDNRAPLVWQTIYPYPQPGKADRRPQVVERQLRAFERLAPEFRALHPLDAGSPQECSEITAHVFRSLRFDTNYQIPSYRRWLDADGHVPAYAFHKRFLQHLQHQQGRGRWVVKCPDHVFAIAAIRAVYPDAGIDFVHRDPVKVLLSVAKLTEVVRRPFIRRLDAAEVGRQESARWLEGAEQMMEAGDDAGLREPILHVHHRELIRDPATAVGRLYRHFGLTLRPEVVAAIGRYQEERPNGGYGPRAYRFEDHGLDARVEREKFRAYMQRFGIEPEHEPGLWPGGPSSAPRKPPVSPLRTATT